MLLAAAQRLPQAHHNREEGIKRDASPAKPQKKLRPGVRSMVKLMDFSGLLVADLKEISVIIMGWSSLMWSTMTS